MMHVLQLTVEQLRNEEKKRNDINIMMKHECFHIITAPV